MIRLVYLVNKFKNKFKISLDKLEEKSMLTDEVKNEPMDIFKKVKDSILTKTRFSNPKEVFAYYYDLEKINLLERELENDDSVCRNIVTDPQFLALKRKYLCNNV